MRFLPINTVLICCTASVGEFALAKIELTSNQQFNGLVIKREIELSPEFLFYFSSTLKEKFKVLETELKYSTFISAPAVNN